MLCVRNSEACSVQHIPRLGAPLSHISASPNGRSVCVSLASNSLVLLDSLTDEVPMPRHIQAVDLPPSSSVKQHGPVIHPIADGMIALTSSGRRVQIMDQSGSLLNARSFCLNPSNVSQKRDDGLEIWHLRRVAFSANNEHVMTCELRCTPALHAFDAESAESLVLKWWRWDDSCNRFNVTSVSYAPHDADVTVALSHPQRASCFITASLDGNFKSWENERGKTSSVWQCVSLGSWQSRPFLCGGLSVDGSVLALGSKGFISLWRPDTAERLHALALEEAGRPTQLSCAMACHRFLLVACVEIQGHTHVLCWDLHDYQVLARVCLSETVGKGRCGLRALPPSNIDGHLSLLAFRTGGDKGPSLAVWHLADSEVPVLELMSSISAPEGSAVADATFDDADRILVWTSKAELWSVNLAKTANEKGAQMVLETPDAQGRLGKLLGDRLPTAAPIAPKMYSLYRRTTVAQQTGLTPANLKNIVPPNTPSHMLPPPHAILSSFVAEFAKQSEAADRQDVLVRPCSETSAMPSWARAKPSVPRSEFVGPIFMDALVATAFAA